MKHGRHSSGEGRITPGSLLDSVDDWMLLVFGLPFVLGVMALWEWEPIAAVVVVGTTGVAVLFGVLLLLQRRAEESWPNALAALLALLVAGVVLLFVSEVVAEAVLEALLWPFRQLVGGFG